MHGVPTITSYDNSDNLAIISNEVRTFNPGLNPLGAPYWLTNAQKRAQQDAGSLVIAFGSENEFRNAMGRKLMVCGVSCRVEKLHSSPPSVQCRCCLGFRHLENRCRNAYKYAEGHPTITYQCLVCRAKGKPYEHSVLKCANCFEAHPATAKTCEIFQATLTKPNISQP